MAGTPQGWPPGYSVPLQPQQVSNVGTPMTTVTNPFLSGGSAPTTTTATANPQQLNTGQMPQYPGGYYYPGWPPYIPPTQPVAGTAPAATGGTTAAATNPFEMAAGASIPPGYAYYPGWGYYPIATSPAPTQTQTAPAANNNPFVQPTYTAPPAQVAPAATQTAPAVLQPAQPAQPPRTVSPQPPSVSVTAAQPALPPRPASQQYPTSTAPNLPARPASVAVASTPTSPAQHLPVKLATASNSQSAPASPGMGFNPFKPESGSPQLPPRNEPDFGAWERGKSLPSAANAGGGDAPSIRRTPVAAPLSGSTETSSAFQRGTTMPAKAIPTAGAPPPLPARAVNKQIEITSTLNGFILTRRTNDFLHVEKKNSQPGAFTILKDKPKDRHLAIYTAYALLGIISVQNESFLVLVTGIDPVGKINGHEIYTINSTHFLSFNPRNEYNYSQQQKSPASPVQKFVNQGLFYFSYDYHLTHSLQRQHTMASDLASKPIWKGADKRFFWNRYLMRHFTKNRLDEYVTVVIRGYVGVSADVYLPESRRKLDLIIISRLSCMRAGTRYNARGVNDDGHVGNFVETEQIVNFDEQMASYVEIRGSVPVFWEEPVVKGSHIPTLSRTPEATVPAFKRHFDMMIETYQRVHIVNLLNSKKTESVITNAYEDQLVRYKGLNSKNIKYTRFDFHEMCANRKYENIRLLINSGPVSSDAEDFGYFLFTKNDQNICKLQAGTFRTNCLDCLDRTNVTQTALAKDGLTKILRDLTGKPYFADVSRLGTVFNDMWANNGDNLSKAYTGTGAMKSSYTRKGKTTVAGLLDDGVKSLARVYINTFKDQDNQEAIDYFLGRIEEFNDDEADTGASWLRQQMISRESEFAAGSDHNIHIGTFNCNNKTPTNVNIDDWLNPLRIDHDAVDMYIFGFQEIVELSATQVWNADTENPKSWERTILNRLNTLRSKKVVTLKSAQLVGIFIVVFVVEDQIQLYRGVDAETVKVGVQGLAGNKGAVGLRFVYKDSSFCFVCAHLSAGARVDYRINDYNTISSSLKFGVNKSYGIPIVDHDYVFWFGDFNFRINLGYQEVVSKVFEQDWEYLLANDQLLLAKRDGLVFRNFEEGEIGFAPTYKYNTGTDIYDTSEKQRVPAWTDRIVWLRSDSCQQLVYNRNEILFSDHRPVKSVFRCRVKTVDREKMKKVEQELNQLAGTAPDAQPATSHRSLPPIPTTGQLLDLPTRPVSVAASSAAGVDAPSISHMDASLAGLVISAPASGHTAVPKQFSDLIRQYKDAIMSVSNEFNMAFNNATLIMSATNLLTDTVKHLLDLLDQVAASHPQTSKFQSELLKSIQAVASSSRQAAANPSNQQMYKQLMDQVLNIMNITAVYSQHY